MEKSGACKCVVSTQICRKDFLYFYTYRDRRRSSKDVKIFDHRNGKILQILGFDYFSSHFVDIKEERESKLDRILENEKV